MKRHRSLGRADIIEGHLHACILQNRSRTKTRPQHGVRCFNFGGYNAHQDRILADPDFDPSYSQLLDFTHVTKIELSPEDIRKPLCFLAHFFSRNHGEHRLGGGIGAIV